MYGLAFAASQYPSPTLRVGSAMHAMLLLLRWKGCGCIQNLSSVNSWKVAFYSSSHFTAFWRLPTFLVNSRRTGRNPKRESGRWSAETFHLKWVWLKRFPCVRFWAARPTARKFASCNTLKGSAVIAGCSRKHFSAFLPVSVIRKYFAPLENISWLRPCKLQKPGRWKSIQQRKRFSST